MRKTVLKVVIIVIFFVFTIGVTNAAIVGNFSTTNAFGATTSVKNVIGKTATTWKGTYYNICNKYDLYGTKVTSTKLNEHSISLTFKPTSRTTGRWTASPFNVFLLPNCDESKSTLRGVYSGSYKIIEDAIFALETIDPKGEKGYSAYMILNFIDDKTVTMTPAGQLRYVVLKKQ